MNKIRSKWDVGFEKQDRITVSKKLTNNFAKCIIDSISRNFISKHPECSLNEIRCAAQYGFWKAIQTYIPLKGKFSTYATYMCRAYINFYYNGHPCYNRRKFETEIEDYHAPEYGNEERMLTKHALKKILSKIPTEHRHVLEQAYIHGDLSSRGGKFDIANRLNLVKRKGNVYHRLNVKIQKALKEARKHIAKGSYIH